MLKLKTEKREKTGSAHTKTLRMALKVPAVYYGPKQETASVTVDKKDFTKVWKEAGETSVVVLSTSEGDVETLIHDVAVHPVTGEPMHADFYVMEKGKPVEVAIPLEFEGESKAIKDFGGTLVKVLHELEISALPKDIPHVLVIDIAELVDLESQILAKDIKLPAGVELVTNPEEVLAAVSTQEEEPEEEVAAEVRDVEVEKKGKKEEGEAEEGAEKSDK